MNSIGNGGPSFGETLEVMQPDTLPLNITKEALDEAILLGSTGDNEPRAKPLIAASGGKAAALEDKAIVAPHYWLDPTGHRVPKRVWLTSSTESNRGEMVPAVSST